MGYKIDPSKAIADFDAMSLTEFFMSKVEGDISHNIETYVELEGGLGRVFMTDAGHRLVDKNIKVNASANFTLDLSDIEKMESLLIRWRDISPPLRYIDFGEKAMIIEDSDQFIIMPKGNRNIEFDLPTE